MKLTRDANTGKILDDGRPVVLCGGHYDLFTKTNKPRSGLARPSKTTPFVVEYSGAPCVVNAEKCSPLPAPKFRAKELLWSGERKWEQLFGVLRDTGCNLLRVWVMGGTAVHPADPARPNEAPFDLYPFVPVKKAGKWLWKVFDAVEHDVWHQPFFDRLAAFAEEADRRGVCIQLTLFNYYDFDDDTGSTTFKSWSQSPWNPDVCLNPSDRPNWGVNHLVKPRLAPRDRNIFFIKPSNGLRQVQRALLRQVVLKLKGRGNVIFELMNEPRNAPHKDVAVFNSEMIDAIKGAAGADWTPLISVNASRPPTNPEFDTDWWREHSTPGAPDFVKNYDRVDVISYHGMTGFNDFKGVAACDRTLSLPAVDPGSMQRRINRHKAEQKERAEKKALMFSTDAARVDALEHRYCDSEVAGRVLDMHVRDGQIDTQYDNNSTEAAAKRALKGDLRNWAYWYFKRALGVNRGLVHLQNHSGFESSFRKIHTGFQEATAVAATQAEEIEQEEETDSAA